MYEYRATVDRWVDGDTVDVTVDLGFDVLVRQRLRLRGIDTPERGEPGWKEATDYARDLAAHGSTVLIETIKDGRGKYGRYLASITLADGSDLVERMLAAEVGKPYDGGAR